MRTPLWLNLLDGPMVPPAVMPHTALGILRNLKSLNARCEDFKAMGEVIAKCESPERIPPYIWYLAEKHVPHWREELHTAMLHGAARQRRTQGRTAILIDACRDMARELVPGLSLLEEAAAWAATMPYDRLFTVSGVVQEVHGAVGIGGIDKILISQPIGPCNVARAAQDVYRFAEFDRLVVFTDKALSGYPPHGFIHCVNNPGWGLYKLDESEQHLTIMSSVKTGTVN